MLQSVKCKARGKYITIYGTKKLLLLYRMVPIQENKTVLTNWKGASTYKYS